MRILGAANPKFEADAMLIYLHILNPDLRHQAARRHSVGPREPGLEKGSWRRRLTFGLDGAPWTFERSFQDALDHH